MKPLVMLTITLTLPYLSFSKEWTNTEGKSIEANLLKVGGNSINLRLENGRDYTIPLSSLSESDATFARELAE
ncbi:MAG: hypothetical protein AAGA96_15850 [Verrucomicrobiota bacterium]